MFSLCYGGWIAPKTKSTRLSFPAQEPLEFLAIDILEPLHKTPRGNKFIVVVCDRFTKLVRTIPLRTITSLAVAQAFFYHWVFVYGMPKTLLSHNGSQFRSKFFRECCIECEGLNGHFLSPYWKESRTRL
jgi:hypothetical protein